MKKNFFLLTLFIGMAGLSGCNHDDDDPVPVAQPAAMGTLFVDGEVFTLGSNSPGNGYNSLLMAGNSAGSSAAFTILDPTTATSAGNLKSITIAFNHDGASTNFDGTYNFFEEGSTTAPTTFAVSALVIGNNTYESMHTSGTATCTKESNGNYRIDFNNVILDKDGEPAIHKTITGYCDLNFTVTVAP